jgi:hypothetical protein
LDFERFGFSDRTELLRPGPRLLSHRLQQRFREHSGIGPECFCCRIDWNAHADTGRESNANTDRAANAFTDTGGESNANPGSIANSNTHASGVAFTYPDTCANRHGHTNVDPNPGLR